MTDADVLKIAGMNGATMVLVRMQDGSSHPFIDGLAVIQWVQSKVQEAKTPPAPAK